MEKTSQQPLPSSDFIKHPVRSLKDFTIRHTRNVAKKTRLPDTKVDEILREFVSLAVGMAAQGMTVEVPTGKMSVVLLPEVPEFSEIGIQSKLLPFRRMAVVLLNEKIAAHGYEHVPSGVSNRALRHMTGLPNIVAQITAKHEKSNVKYQHAKSYML